MKTFQPILQFRDPHQWVLLLRVLTSIPMVWFLSRWMEISNLLKYLDQPAKNRNPLGPDEIEQAKFIWNYAHFILVKCLQVKNPCFLRSLLLFWILRGKGLESKIYFGVKKRGSPLEGHSWISLNGKFLLEESDPQLTYIDIFAYPYEGKTP